MNTLAVGRLIEVMELVGRYGLAAALEWSSPLSSLLIRVALDTLYCPNCGHVRIGACLASLTGISRTKPEGGADQKSNYFNKP